MRISAAYPSAYLKAADLQDRNVTVIIDKVVLEDIGGDQKPVIYFRGKERGLVCNRTNANNISHAYGEETDNWIGREIILYPTIVDFQGRSVDAIRVKTAARVSYQAPPPPQVPAQQVHAQQRDDMSDEVPF
jgi:hypothetical protein